VAVRLRFEGEPLIGRAEGPLAAGEVERLLLRATLAALEPLWPLGVQLIAGDVARVPLGRGEAILVEIRLVEEGTERRLVGARPLEGERDLLVVAAALEALAGTLTAQGRRDWTEVRVRPEPERSAEEGAPKAGGEPPTPPGATGGGEAP
jgi:hypothetical protein